MGDAMKRLLAEMRDHRPLTTPFIESAKQQAHQMRAPELYGESSPFFKNEVPGGIGPYLEMGGKVWKIVAHQPGKGRTQGTIGSGRIQRVTKKGKLTGREVDVFFYKPPKISVAGRRRTYLSQTYKDLGTKFLNEEASEGGFKLNVARVPLARARAYAERVFKSKGKSLDEELPDFDANYMKVQASLKKALNIPRSRMPVIEPKDINQFQKALRGGYIDIFKPHYKGRINFIKGQQVPMPADQAEKFLQGGVRDGDLKDDQVKVALTTTSVGRLLPIQSEIWLEKLIGNIAQYGPPSSGSPVLKKTLIISADNRIIDGHHRWAQATLADPGLSMKTLRVPFKIKALLDLARTYGAAIGRTYKESMSEASAKTTKFAANELVMKYGKGAARMTARTRVAVWTKRGNEKQIAYWTEVLRLVNSR